MPVTLRLGASSASRWIGACSQGVCPRVQRLCARSLFRPAQAPPTEAPGAVGSSEDWSTPPAAS